MKGVTIHWALVAAGGLLHSVSGMLQREEGVPPPLFNAGSLLPHPYSCFKPSFSLSSVGSPRFLVPRVSVCVFFSSHSSVAIAVHRCSGFSTTSPCRRARYVSGASFTRGKRVLRVYSECCVLVRPNFESHASSFESQSVSNSIAITPRDHMSMALV